MIARQNWRATVGFWATLLALDSVLYFRHAAHFFQGDAIFMLNHRASSLAGYFREFVALNPSGWFRPLAMEVIESAFFPVFGLSPVPYRIPVYGLFLLITASVYKLALALTRRPLTAAITTLFFTIHTTNAYTTYDVSFMPELLYTFFYVAAVVAFLKYLDGGDNIAYWCSIICFVGALLSKEPAVTLPGMLFLTGILFGRTSQNLRERVVACARSIAPHLLILAVYLIYAFGYLHVQGITADVLLKKTPEPEADHYVSILNEGFFSNAQIAVAWAFNFPRGWWGQWQNLTQGMLIYLDVFCGVSVVLGVWALFKPERRVLLYGIVWFWLTVIPPLVLVSHFVPYYLFLPIVGFSMAVGVAFASAYDAVKTLQPIIVTTTLMILFAGLFYVNNRSIRGTIYDNWLLGGSAKLAEDTLRDLKRFYPTVAPHATIYFSDADEHLEWVHDYGGLVKMGYGTDNISIMYQSQGDVLSSAVVDPLVFQVRSGHLLDETEFYRANSAKLITFADSDLQLRLSTADVIAGQGRYALKIDRLPNKPIQVAYTVNDGPLQTFTTTLDALGEVNFDVSRDTKPGLYKFWAFKTATADSWFRADQTLRVR